MTAGKQRNSRNGTRRQTGSGLGSVGLRCPSPGDRAAPTDERREPRALARGRGRWVRGPRRRRGGKDLSARPGAARRGAARAGSQAEGAEGAEVPDGALQGRSQRNCRAGTDAASGTEGTPWEKRGRWEGPAVCRVAAQRGRLSRCFQEAAEGRRPGKWAKAVSKIPQKQKHRWLINHEECFKPHQ